MEKMDEKRIHKSLYKSSWRGWHTLPQPTQPAHKHYNHGATVWGHDSQLWLAGGATKRRPPSLEPKQQEETAHEGALLLNLQATQELGRRQTAMEGCSQQTVITADYLRRQVEKAPECDRMIERKVRVEERKVVQVPPIWSTNKEVKMWHCLCRRKRRSSD